MARQIITKAEVIDAVRAGKSPLIIAANAIVTAAAQEAAQEQGLRIERQQEATPVAHGTEQTIPPLQASAVSTEGERNAQETSSHSPSVDRDAIRAAVIAKLGNEPRQLDAVLDRVLGS